MNKRNIKTLIGCNLFFLFGCIPSAGMAQSVADTVFAREPEWMEQLQTPKVDGQNYYEILRRFEAYKSSLPGGGKKTPYNKHVLNYFTRWQKMIEPFVYEDGTIHLPEADRYQEDLNRLNALPVRQERVRSVASDAKSDSFSAASDAKSDGFSVASDAKSDGFSAASDAKSNSFSAASDVESDGSPVADWKVVAPLITYDYKTKKPAPWQSNIQRFDVFAGDENILYCGSETGMIFKTTDQGKHWRPCAPMHYFGGEITTVEVSRTNPDKVLVGGGMTLWLTQDGGDSWQNVTPSGVKPFQRIRDAVFDPGNDSRILMGSDEGVFLSEDNGKTWTRKMNGRCFDIKFQRREQAPKVYMLVDKAGENAGGCLYVSTDGGGRFEKAQLPDTHISSGRIAVTAANPDYVYLLACQGWDNQHPFFRGEPYIFKSTDGGRNWEKQAIASQMNSMDRSGGQGYYDMVIAASPKDPEHLLFGILFLYSSHDGGKTLDRHPQNSTGRPDYMSTEIGGYYGEFDLHTDMQDLHISEKTGETWLSTDGGLIYCANMMEQEPEVRNEGIYASEFWGFDQGWNEDVMAGGRNHNGNMVRLSDYGSVSVALRGSEHATGYVFLSNPRKVTFSDTQQKLLVPDRWTDEFKDFEHADRFWVYPKESTRYGVGFEYDPRYAQNFLIVTSSAFGLSGSSYNMLWRTTDDGLSYTKLHEFEGDISSYAISRSNPDKIVVAAGTELYYSLNGGQDFEKYETLPEMRNTLEFKVAVHPLREDEIWVSTHTPGGMYRTRDNGATWEKMDRGLEMQDLSGQTRPYEVTRFFLTGNEKDAVYAIADVRLDYTQTTFVYAGRVVYWDEEQNRWSDYSQGLPSMIRVNRMLPFYKEGKIRIATNNGVWETALADSMFAPIAQPLLLNAGTGKDLKTTELQFDSYSIANQQDATWEWTFRPQPLQISDAHARNPRVTVEPDQSYDVTLTVTNARGERDTKTVHNMIEGSKGVPTGLTDNSSEEREATLFPTLLSPGDPLCFTVKGFTAPLGLTVYNMQGQAVLNKELNEGTNRIGVSLPSSGMYLYRIEQGSYTCVGRFYVK